MCNTLEIKKCAHFSISKQLITLLCKDYMILKFKIPSYERCKGELEALLIIERPKLV